MARVTASVAHAVIVGSAQIVPRSRAWRRSSTNTSGNCWGVTTWRSTSVTPRVGLATFTTDGVFRCTGLPEGSPLSGRYQGTRRAGRVRQGPLRHRQGSGRHWNANLVIDGDGETATMRCYLLALTAGGGKLTGTTGIYEDRLGKVDRPVALLVDNVRHRHYRKTPPSGIVQSPYTANPSRFTMADCLMTRRSQVQILPPPPT